MLNPASANWARIPEELRRLKRWCVAGPSLCAEEPKAPHSLGANGKPYKASSTNPDGWLEFEVAASYAAHFADVHIGFMLLAGDGYSCIDLDVKDASNEPAIAKWTTQQQLDRFWSIVQAFDSYTERSRSGRGLHIWVRGEIGQGCKRDGAELYSQERFIITTGDALLDKPIEERQEFLGILASEMRAGQVRKYELEELEETEDDMTILARAMEASNNSKFNELCLGDWASMGYPSQSEADLALMSIFTFYSKSNEQCRRLFRMSGLGKRDKAMKDDRHLDNTLKIIRSRQEREQAIDAVEMARAADLVREIQAGQYRPSVGDRLAASALAAAPVAAALAPLAPDGDHRVGWPPGFAGAIAGFIYNSSPRPVREVAIVATLGLLAGICGKSFGIPGSGLNLYVILVARSAIGKEAMHSGLGALISAVRETTPAAQTFVDFADFASGPALSKACALNQSFVNVSGEWGRKLKRLSAEDGRDGPMQQLRTVMTNLYQKSGPSSVVGGISYSNKEQNVASVNGVAYSMIGETTPGTFYDALTESMMEDGFLSRFTVVEYDGPRPAANSNLIKQPDKVLTEALCGLCVHSLTLLSRFQTQQVMFDEQSEAMLKAFDAECDGHINSTDDEGWRQMWNRAHLKVLRLSALLASADNWLAPVVNAGHVAWSLDLVRRDISIMQRRIESGDIGTGDNARERKLLDIIRAYMQDELSEGYKIPKALQQAGIIPRKFMQMRCARVSSFTTHRNGSTNAMDMALRSLVDSGYLVECDKAKLILDHNFHGRCFKVVSMPDWYRGK